MTDILRLTRPDDWHLHLRDGDTMRAVLPFTAERFGRAIVMPNLKPPVTTTQAARALAARSDLTDVTVLTSGLNIALELEPTIPRLNVVVLGGTLRPLQHSLVDPLAALALDHVNAHTVLLGCNGVDPAAGVTNVNLPEADVKRRLIQASRRRIVLADGSKLGTVHMARVCDLDEVDVVVTGPSADPEVVDALRERAVDVVVAD